jgi:hypothetical protein
LISGRPESFLITGTPPFQAALLITWALQVAKQSCGGSQSTPAKSSTLVEGNTIEACPLGIIIQADFTLVLRIVAAAVARL